jgi:hypothetical protein
MKLVSVLEAFCYDRRIMNNEDRKWYGVRYLVHEKENDFYEERIIILRADNSDAALDKGTINAKEYCESLGYILHYIEEFPIVDDAIEEYSEVYSIMRETPDSPEDYVKKYMKTGDEVNMKETELIE